MGLTTRQGGTKLSLHKKAKKETKAMMKDILHGSVDLNETCDFTVPMKPKDRGHSAASTSVEVFKEVDDELSVCQTCGKNIAHMNSTRRQQHINRCLDRQEETDRQVNRQKQELENAKTATLDCPMCGKHLKSDQTRTSHLKKCAHDLGVPTERMLALVKEQEAERQKLVSVGIVPQTVSSAKPKATSSSTGSKKRKLKATESEYDEEMQVAMAISTSLIEQETRKNSTLIGHLNINKNSAQRTEREKRKGKKRKVVQETPVLLELSDAEKSRRLAEKVNTVLVADEDLCIDNSPPLQTSDLHCTVTDMPGLWTRSIGAEEGSGDHMFYVETLMPPIQMNKIVTGSKMKEITSIPGRNTSLLEKPYTNDKVEKGNDCDATDAADDVLTVSTQTAVVLAELVADAGADDTKESKSQMHSGKPSEMTPIKSEKGERSLQGDITIEDISSQKSATRKLSGSNSVDLHSSGFYVTKNSLQEEEQTIVRKKLVNDLSSLINNRSFSDVTLVSCDGQTVHGHQVILGVRCPQLIKLIVDHEIKLNVSGDALSVLLNYLYSGKISTTESEGKELLALCEELELHELKDCLELLEQSENEENKRESDKTEEEEDLEIINTCKLKDVWGESESEESDDDGNSCLGDYRNSGKSKGDYYNILCTQKRTLGACSDRNQEESADQVSTAEDTATDSDADLVQVRTGNNGLHDSFNIDNELDMNLSLSPVKQKICVHGLSEKRSLEKTKTQDVMYTDNQSLTSPTAAKEKMTCDLRETETSESDYHRSEDKRKAVIEIDTDDEDDINISSNQSYVSMIHSEAVTPAKTSLHDTSCGDLFYSPSPDKDVSELTPFKNSPLQNQSPALSPVKYSPPEDNVCVPDKIDEVCNSKIRNSGKRKGRTVRVSNKNKNVNGTFSQEVLDNDIKKSQSGSAGQGCNGSVFGIESDKSNYINDNVSDEEVEIIGDNLHELSQTSASPTFKDRRHRHSGLRKKLLSDTLNQKNDGSSEQCIENDTSTNCLNESQAHMNFSEIHMDFDEIHAGCDKDHEVTNDYRTRKRKCIKSGYISLSEDCSVVIDVDKDLESLHSSQSPDGQTEVEGGDKMDVDGVNCLGDNSNQMLDQSLQGAGVVDREEDNVWDDFDDLGAGFGDMMTLQQKTPVRHSTGDSTLQNLSVSEEHKEGKNNQADDIKLGAGSQHHKRGSTAGSLFEDSLDYGQQDSAVIQENDVMLDDDDSFLLRADRNEVQEESNTKYKAKGYKEKQASSFKTPTAGARNLISKKPWVPPSPYTPMPEYDKMNTPMLKREVQKIGVKAVSKKRMVKLLKDVYEQTHQYETDSECEDVGPSTGSGDGSQSGSQDEDMPSSQESDRSEMFEESMLHMSDDSDVPLSPQKGVDLKKKLMGYVKLNKELHIKILMYEPLELEILKQQLKDAGIKCGNDKLMEVLDEMCITFTMKNTRPAHRGKKTAKKTKSPTKQKRKTASPRKQKDKTKSPTKCKGTAVVKV